MQPLYRRCLNGCGNVRAVAIADDLNLVGQAPAVFQAFDQFEKELSTGSGLVLRKEKCAVLWPRSDLPAYVRDEAKKRGLPCRIGTMETLGGCVGSGDLAFHKWLTEYVQGMQPYFDSLLHPDLPAQVAFLLLRLSAAPKIGFLTRVVPPRLLQPHAIRFDELVVDTFARKCALPNPLADAAKFTSSLPVRLGGLGLRSAAATSVAAYYCSLSAAAPHIIDDIIPLAHHE